MQITRTSQATGKTHTREMDVTQDQLDRWQGGESIQDVFPHLSAPDREFLKTGITAAEWQEHIVTGEDTEE